MKILIPVLIFCRCWTALAGEQQDLNYHKINLESLGVNQLAGDEVWAKIFSQAEIAVKKQNLSPVEVLNLYFAKSSLYGMRILDRKLHSPSQIIFLGDDKDSNPYERLLSAQGQAMRVGAPVSLKRIGKKYFVRFFYGNKLGLVKRGDALVGGFPLQLQSLAWEKPVTLTGNIEKRNAQDWFAEYSRQSLRGVLVNEKSILYAHCASLAIIQNCKKDILEKVSKYQATLLDLRSAKGEFSSSEFEWLQRFKRPLFVLVDNETESSLLAYLVTGERNFKLIAESGVYPQYAMQRVVIGKSLYISPQKNSRRFTVAPDLSVSDTLVYSSGKDYGVSESFVYIANAL